MSDNVSLGPLTQQWNVEVTNPSGTVYVLFSDSVSYHEAQAEVDRHPNEDSRVVSRWVSGLQ